MLHSEVWTIHYLAILLLSRIQDLSWLRVFQKIDAIVAFSQTSAQRSQIVQTVLMSCYQILGQRLTRSAEGLPASAAEVEMAT